MAIRLNRIKCKKCGDIITSEYTHDFKSCRCGAVMVDGGHSYLKRSGNREDWEEMSDYDTIDDGVVKREYLGFQASIYYDQEDKILVGIVTNVKDFLAFHGRNPSEVEDMFHQCIDNYLEQKK